MHISIISNLFNANVLFVIKFEKTILLKKLKRINGRDLKYYIHIVFFDYNVLYGIDMNAE